MNKFKMLAAAVASAAICGVASAEHLYVGGSFGITQQSDSDNSGQTGAFTTGNLGDGSTLDVAAGTPYNWSTEFDNGTNISAEFGKRYASGLRAGIELSFSEADVDTHTGVTLGGIDLTNVDAAAVLGLGDTTGLLIGDVVANGQGDISQTAIYANVYYDFALDSPIQPYVGAGLGIADVDVKFNPSDVGIIDDSETKLAYQFKAGVTYKLANQWEVFGEYAYRATEDIEVNNDLFPGTLDIENEQNVFSFGARYRFGAHSAS